MSGIDRIRTLLQEDRSQDLQTNVGIAIRLANEVPEMISVIEDALVEIAEALSYLRHVRTGCPDVLQNVENHMKAAQQRLRMK